MKPDERLGNTLILAPLTFGSVQRFQVLEMLMDGGADDHMLVMF